jgi:zinc D-Ala-D-Ala carboxypeptidase
VDWTAYKNFTPLEFVCRHTGRQGVKPELLDFLQQVRDVYARPMVITSGYRHRTHPIEAVKSTPGAHATGLAADIRVGPGSDVNDLVFVAMSLGARGVGISQRAGRGRFVHLDLIDRTAMWSY